MTRANEATRFELLTTAVTLTVAVAAAAWMTVQWTAPLRRRAALLPKHPIDASAAHWRGSSNATKGILVFSDFECPYCGELATNVLPIVTKEVVDTGLARLGFLSLPLESIHKNALAAAVAAECAGNQGRFWDMHDLLFASQERLGQRDLVDRATTLGLDEREFSACTSQSGEAPVRASQLLSKQLGLPGTPIIFVGDLRSNGEFNAITTLSGVVGPEEIVQSVRMAGSTRISVATILAAATALGLVALVIRRRMIGRREQSNSSAMVADGSGG